MDRSKILVELNAIFINIMDDKGIRLKETDTNNDIDEWESLCHIQLINAIEKHFKIRFTTAEIQEEKSVSTLINAVSKKIKN